MSQRILECVPNFSEGRNAETIAQIAQAAASVNGVAVLDVDPGAGAHRTVITFAGPPEAVVEAAVRAGREASLRIDLSTHHGAHPRIGAMDVCPLVPVSGVTMEEAVQHAHTLARRLGDEVGLTVYCYEAAARTPQRRNLADIRAGEYEGLAAKLADPSWAPDEGPATFHPRWGATVVGARDFLLAYNVNLDTTSTKVAHAIACDVRTSGRVRRRPDGHPERTPGTLGACKALGWFIEEYGFAQVSMNLTHLPTTPLHVAFSEVCRSATSRGIQVTGSELIGMSPLSAMLDAGRHALTARSLPTEVSERALIDAAVDALGLDQLAPFHPERKIIELALAAAQP